MDYSIQIIIISAYVRSIVEYILPPIILVKQLNAAEGALIEWIFEKNSSNSLLTPERLI